jgi:hypothetical protein
MNKFMGHMVKKFNTLIFFGSMDGMDCVNEMDETLTALVGVAETENSKTYIFFGLRIVKLKDN